MTMKIKGKELLNNEKIKIVGSHYINGESLVQSNTASGYMLKLKGNSLTLRINMIDKRGENQKTPIGILKNLDYKNKTVMYLDSGINELKIPLSDEPITYSILKLDEAEDDAIETIFLELDGEFLDLEIYQNGLVIGDSTTAAYGNLGTINDARKTINSDGTQGFSYMALSDLGYIPHMITASGFGVYASFWTDPQVKPIIEALKSLSIMDTKIPFDYSFLDPKIIILSLGTNDLSYVNDTKDDKIKKERYDNFVIKYKEFIRDIRDTFKDSKIIMVYGCCREKEIFDYDLLVHSDLSKEMSDLYIVKLDGDMSGCANHPSVKNHYEMKEILKDFIRNI